MMNDTESHFNISIQLFSESNFTIISFSTFDLLQIYFYPQHLNLHLCSSTFKASYLIFGSLCQLYIESSLKFFKKKNLLILLSHVEFGIAYDSFTAISFFRINNAKFCLHFTKLLRYNNGHSKHPLPTAQKKIIQMDITRCSTPKSE